MDLTPDALLDLTFVADPQISPDGRTAMATVTSIVRGEGDEPPRYRTRIHRFALEPHAADDRSRTPEERSLLTTGDGKDTHPRFDPGGAFAAFLRSGDDRPAQLHAIPLTGGEARELVHLEGGVTTFAWRPTGDALALVGPASRRKPFEGGTPLRTSRSRYKSDADGFLPDVTWNVSIVSLNGGLGGDLHTLHAFPFRPEELRWSADGRVLYVRAATDDAEDAELRSNILALEVGADGAAVDDPVPLLPAAMQIATFAAPDEEGTLAFLAPEDFGAATAPTALWRVAREGGEPQRVTRGVDAASSVAADSRYGAYPQTPSPDANGWLAIVNQAGRSHLALVRRSGTVERRTDGDRAVTAFARHGERVVFVAETPDRPGELYVLGADGVERRLSDFHDRLTSTFAFRHPGTEERIRTADGELAYWRLDPQKPRNDAAIVVQVHGGPAANYGYGFMFEFQLLAAAGYTVVYGNPRGGSSFGTDFATAIQGRYGTIDAADVMAIVEDAASRHVRPDAPVHLTGGSYGGFMTNWLVGTTRRFRSAVTQRSICNFVSFYGTSDIGPFFAEREIGGRPWSDPQRMWEQSPLRHAASIETPLLILHAEKDHRCPIEQAEQLYGALKRIGKVETELVRFPDEGHELSRSGRPDRRIARLRAILDWFERHA